MRAFAGGQRREMAETAVARRGASIAVACRVFGVSETCYRYSPLLSDENEEIADLLVGLTEARKTWGFGPCFLHLRTVKGSSHCRHWFKAMARAWNHKRVYPLALRRLPAIAVRRIYCELELNLRPLMV